MNYKIEELKELIEEAIELTAELKHEFKDDDVIFGALLYAGISLDRAIDDLKDIK